jgi:hypothetical protein
MKVTKWSIFAEDFAPLLEVLNVSEQKPEQTSGEPGSLSAEPAASTSSNAPSEPVAAATGSTQESKAGSSDADPRKRVPELGEAAKTPGKTPEVDAPKAEGQGVDAQGTGAPEPDAPKPEEPRIPGNVVILSSGDRAWNRKGAGPRSEAAQGSGMFGKRRLAALAAVVALAVLTGAIGGVLATVGLKHFADDDAATSGNRTLEASIARIDGDIAALKANIEQNAKTGMSQFSKASDRLDKVEKAQAEPAARLAKLSEAVDKLRSLSTASPASVAAAPVAAKEVTGSIAPPATAAPVGAPKADVARLPTLEGWVLRDVGNGGALIQGRQGMYEVYAGDAIPGLGRVDAVRRQDGRWVVVTSKGLIVAR